MKRFVLLGFSLLLAAAQAALAQGEPAAWRLEAAPLHAGLSSPVGMAYDAQGNLYVANWSAGTVLRFSPDGKRSVFAKGLSSPSGLAVSPAGEIYVASYSEDAVWRFTSQGERSVFVKGLATPAGLSFDRRGRLLIANRRTNQILAATPDGRLETLAEGLQTPVGVVELADGALMVGNIAGGISLVSGNAPARTVNADLRSPGPGIVTAGPDAVYVVDYGGTTVSRIDRTGRRSVLVDGLSSPVGLARAPDGSLVVATWDANAIYRIVPR